MNDKATDDYQFYLENFQVWYVVHARVLDIELLTVTNFLTSNV
jgi:hypothetical protein